MNKILLRIGGAINLLFFLFHLTMVKPIDVERSCGIHTADLCLSGYLPVAWSAHDSPGAYHSDRHLAILVPARDQPGRFLWPDCTRHAHVGRPLPCLWSSASHSCDPGVEESPERSSRPVCECSTSPVKSKQLIP